MADKFYGTPATPDPAPAAAWRKKPGPADDETRRRMMAEALKSQAPVSYAPPAPPAGKKSPKGGSNIRVEMALRAAGA